MEDTANFDYRLSQLLGMIAELDQAITELEAYAELWVASSAT